LQPPEQLSDRLGPSKPRSDEAVEEDGVAVEGDAPKKRRRRRRKPANAEAASVVGPSE